MSSTPDILKRFGDRLRSLRKKRGLSQEAFAAKCALDRTYVGGIERGERNVSMRNLETLAQALEMRLSELLKGL